MRRTARATIILLAAVTFTAASAAERLYNGIELPDQWPPERHLQRQAHAAKYLAVETNSRKAIREEVAPLGM